MHACVVTFLWGVKGSERERERERERGEKKKKKEMKKIPKLKRTMWFNLC